LCHLLVSKVHEGGCEHGVERKAYPHALAEKIDLKSIESFTKYFVERRLRDLHEIIPTDEDSTSAYKAVKFKAK
jgi:hypothetical protein